MERRRGNFALKTCVIRSRDAGNPEQVAHVQISIARSDLHYQLGARSMARVNRSGSEHESTPAQRVVSEHEQSDNVGNPFHSTGAGPGVPFPIHPRPSSSFSVLLSWSFIFQAPSTIGLDAYSALAGFARTNQRHLKDGQCLLHRTLPLRGFLSP